MPNYYSNEPDILKLVALIKEHGIRKAIVSPGSTNISFAASLLYDKDFEVYSAVDERSAAYMACGMAEEIGEPVLISCTGATAARNYVPALTEAFYRKLPVLVITSSQFFDRAGHLFPQVTDRSHPLNDILIKSVQIPIAHTEEEKWSNTVKINDALLELKRHGGGPVHINIETSFSFVFNQPTLPKVRKISRYMPGDELPDINVEKIAIFVGAHSVFSDKLTKTIDEFCEKYNAVVVCDHTSNYQGKFRILGGIVERQKGYYAECRKMPLLIHIGEMSGSYYKFQAESVWRVNPDGEIRDKFYKLKNVFEMNELYFFEKYNQKRKKTVVNSFFAEWETEEKKLMKALPEIPFSNCWIASQTAKYLPEKSEIHFGILNSLRMWNLFELPKTVIGHSNVGGFGIDGCISSLIGASLADKDKLFFIILGDLATFYDLNSLGNRHIGNNVRIMVINNGTGFEMRHYGNRGEVFGEDADILFAAGGHFGNKSRTVLKHYSEDMGFKYMTAEDKTSYLKQYKEFISPKPCDKPILFEVFVDVKDEADSFRITEYTIENKASVAKNAVKSILGEEGTHKLKTLLKR